ncbi:rhodanese-like domain-containing protein [Sphingosinicella sp.]|uniref:rhodanese-like domain-containing protein n=1 Tax=Sphingosinicella sp. TaxID=1917971 RepID=UPI0040377E25
MTSGVQAFDRLAEALAEIRPRFGAGAFSDRRRVIGLLADKAPDAKREIRVVGTAIDEGIPAALARTERHLVGVEMDRLANGLEASTGLRLDIARQVVRAFAFAMDLGPLPSIYEAATMPVAPVAPPAAPVPAPTGGWTGMTAPVHPAPPASPISQYPPHSQPTQPYQAAPGAATPMAFASVPAQKPNMAGRIALGVGGVILLAFGVSQMMGPGGSGAGNNVVVSGETGFAGELVDQGIAAQSELNANLGSPTPLSIAVGQRVTTAELQGMIQEDPQVVLVDVLAQAHDQTIQGSYWLPSGGSAGSFQDSYQSDFAAGLNQVTGGVYSRPVVFFCAGANCWESYNATLRANAAGYTRLFWYRGGLASWAEARLPMAPLPTQGAAQGQADPQQQDQPTIDPPIEQPTDPNGATTPTGDKIPTE